MGRPEYEARLLLDTEVVHISQGQSSILKKILRGPMNFCGFIFVAAGNCTITNMYISAYFMGLIFNY